MLVQRGGMSALGPSLNMRPWRDPATRLRYRVQLCPREHTGAMGADRRSNALVFETADSEWVGSVPIYHTIALWGLDDQDLGELLEQAIGRG